MRVKLLAVSNMPLSQLVRQKIFDQVACQTAWLVSKHAITHGICQQDLPVFVDHDDGLDGTLKYLPECVIESEGHVETGKWQYKKVLTKISFFIDSRPDIPLRTPVCSYIIQGVMKQILCVIDLSASSEKVLEVAARIASAWRAHLVVLYPYRLIDYGHTGDMSTLRRKLEAEACEKFYILQRGVPNMESLSHEFKPEIGFVADRVIDYTKTNSIAMVIVAQPQTDSGNDLKSFNVQSLIRNSKVPFVIVPCEVSAEAKSHLNVTT
jgi:Universal stress protein family